MFNLEFTFHFFKSLKTADEIWSSANKCICLFWSCLNIDIQSQSKQCICSLMNLMIHFPSSRLKSSSKLLVSHKWRCDLGIKWQSAFSVPISGITEQHDCSRAPFFPVCVMTSSRILQPSIKRRNKVSGSSLAHSLPSCDIITCPSERVGARCAAAKVKQASGRRATSATPSTVWDDCICSLEE